ERELRRDRHIYAVFFSLPAFLPLSLAVRHWTLSRAFWSAAMLRVASPASARSPRHLRAIRSRSRARRSYTLASNNFFDDDGRAILIRMADRPFQQQVSAERSQAYAAD